MKLRLLVRAVMGALVLVFLILTSALRAADADIATAPPSTAPSVAPASTPPAAQATSVPPPAEQATSVSPPTEQATSVSPPAGDHTAAPKKGLAWLLDRLPGVRRRAESGDLAAAVKRLTDENAALKRQLANRDKAARRLAAVTSRFEDARKELLVLKNDNAELNDNLRTTIKERDRLSRAVRKEQSTRDLEEAEDTIARLQRENADLQSEHASLTTRLAQAAAATAASTVSAAADSAEEVARLKDELGKANLKVDMTVHSFALIQQENEKLKAQIEQATSVPPPTTQATSVPPPASTD
jgi:regulator of replication initiation timing